MNKQIYFIYLHYTVIEYHQGWQYVVNLSTISNNIEQNIKISKWVCTFCRLVNLDKKLLELNLLNCNYKLVLNIEGLNDILWEKIYNRTQILSVNTLLDYVKEHKVL